MGENPDSYCSTIPPPYPEIYPQKEKEKMRELFKSLKNTIIINNNNNKEIVITEEKLKELKEFRDNNKEYIIDQYKYDYPLEISSQSVNDAVDYEINSYVMDKQFRIHKLNNRTDLPSDMYIFIYMQIYVFFLIVFFIYFFSFIFIYLYFF